MIVEVGREVQRLTGNIMGYLNVLGLSPRTYGSWARGYADGTLVVLPPKPPSPQEAQMLEELRCLMKELAHRRHYTFGLAPLWAQYRGRVTREEFRQMAREVRQEVKRELRNKLLRYEFTHPDVCHSLDFSGLPREGPAGPKRYLIKILDECTRLTLRRAITPHKGAGVGARFVADHLREGQHPLVFKYDREFDVPQFENLLLMHKIVPLPNPGHYPPFNGKTERSNKDVQLWLGAFESDTFWSYDELSEEMNFCFEQLDEIEERAMFGGRTRRTAYEELPRASVDREPFFLEADALKRSIMNRPNVRVHPADAWRLAAKEVLKRYGLVKYSRP